MLKRTRSHTAHLHPYYDLEDALQLRYKRRRWAWGTLILWVVGMVWIVQYPPVQFTSWLHTVITVGLGGLLALGGLLMINLAGENLNFGDERDEQRLLKECLVLLQPYVNDSHTLESIATLAERRSTRVQLRIVVPGLLVTGFVAFAVVDVVPANLFAVLLFLTAIGTFSLLFELAKAHAAGIIQDAVEIAHYEQKAAKQGSQAPTQQLLEALVLSNNGHKTGVLWQKSA